MLYYLSMMGDGEVTNEEKKIFEKLCKTLELDDEDKNVAVSACKELYQKYGDVVTAVKEERIDDNVGVYVPLGSGSVYDDARNMYDNTMSMIGLKKEKPIDVDILLDLDDDEDEVCDDEWDEVEDASDNKDAAPIIWNLINLVYADKDYSSKERSLLNYLMRKWKFKKELYYEMIDTAETVMMLNKEKEWVKSTLPEGVKRKKQEARIKQDIKQLYEGIKITIDELSL